MKVFRILNVLAAAALCALLSLVPASAFAALAIDGTPQSSTGGSVTTVTFTLSTSNSNDMIIVASVTNSPAISGITGPGLTFTQRAVEGTNIVEEWSAVASSPLTSASIVITYASSAAFYTAAVFAVSGANTTTKWDSNGGIPVTGTTAADPSVSTTNANDIIFGIFRFSTAGTPTVGAGWTNIANPTGGFTLVEYKIVTSAQSGLTVAVGTGTANENGYIVDAIIQGGGGGAVQSKAMLLGIGATLRAAPDSLCHDIDPIDFRRRAANESIFKAAA